MVKHWNKKHNQRASKKLSGQKSTLTSESPGCPSPITPIITTSAPQSGFFDYFALPGEVRNQIMDLLLKPGEIHYPQPSTKNTHSPPAVQFLASSRQAYTEGCGIFFSDNTFHLPAGPAAYTKSLFGQYQPQTLALIRSVTLHIGLHDLGYTDGYKQFDDRNCGEIKLWKYDEINDCLEKIWRSKIIFVRNKFRNLEEFRIVFSDLDYDVETKDKRINVNLHQPYVIRGSEATIPGANDGAAPKRVVTLVYKGEEIKAGLQDISMKCHMEWIKDRSYSHLHWTLVEATGQFWRELREFEFLTWEGLRSKLAEKIAEHERSICR
jgi:hypothetical protein